MLYLKKYVKFRKEPRFILLCDCSNITNYDIPLVYWKLLIKLQQGYDPKKPLGIKREADMIADFKKLKLLSSSIDSNEGFEEANWIHLDYSESELFKK